MLNKKKRTNNGKNLRVILTTLAWLVTNVMLTNLGVTMYQDSKGPKEHGTF